MECKGCKLLKKTEVLEKYDGYCTFCFRKLNPHLFCTIAICREQITSEQSKNSNNLCVKHYTIYKKLLPKKEQIKNIIGFLNKTFISIFVVSLTVVILKFNGQKEIEWEHIKFEFSKLWIIYLILTIVHLFMRTLLLNAISDFEGNKIDQLRDEILSDIASSDNLFFNGFVPKYSLRHKAILLKRLNENMNFLLFLITFLLMFIANLNFYKFDIINIVISLTLVIYNIIIASSWTIRLSLLK